MGIYINLAFEKAGWKSEKKSQFQSFTLITDWERAT